MRPIAMLLSLMLALASWSAKAAGQDVYGDEHTIHYADMPKDAPRFEQFPASEKFGGRVAAPDVRSPPWARGFRTAIRTGARQGPDFAGHYTLVGWGCGAGCQALAIVDANSGKIFDSPMLRSVDNINVAFDGPEGTNERLIKYRKDSRLLVVVGGINEDPKLRGISYFVWEHNRFKRIRFLPKPYGY